MTVAARSCSRLTAGAPGRGPEQVGLVERQPGEQDRAVLEDRAAAAHLRRSAQLAVAHPQVGALLAGEAHRSRGTVVAGDGRLDPEPGQPGDEGSRQRR